VVHDRHLEATRRPATAKPSTRAESRRGAGRRGTLRPVGGKRGHSPRTLRGLVHGEGGRGGGFYRGNTCTW